MSETTAQELAPTSMSAEIQPQGLRGRLRRFLRRGPQTRQEQPTPEAQPTFTLTEGAYQLANPEHSEICEDALGRVELEKGGQKISRWIGIDGSGGSIPESDPDRSRKVADVASKMSQAVYDTNLESPTDVLLKADKLGRNLPGYGTGIVADINPQTGKVDIAHAGDFVALKWNALRPYQSKRLYETSGPSYFQQLTQQHNLAEALRAGGKATTRELEGVQVEGRPASSIVTKVIGDETRNPLTPSDITTAWTSLDKKEYLLLMSDGGGIGDLLTDNSEYQQEVHRIMTVLQNGDISAQEASEKISYAALAQAKGAGGDHDDISVAVIGRKKGEAQVESSGVPPAAEAKQEGKEPWRGLIFDDPQELAQEVGLPKEIAEQLVVVHLMDEQALLRISVRNSQDRPLAMEAMARYRQENGLTLNLPDDAKLEKAFPSLTQPDIQILKSKFGGVDLANSKRVSEVLNEVYREETDSEIPDRLDTAIQAHVGQKINSDLRAKKAEAEAGTQRRRRIFGRGPQPQPVVQEEAQAPTGEVQEPSHAGEEGPKVEVKKTVKVSLRKMMAVFDSNFKKLEEIERKKTDLSNQDKAGTTEFAELDREYKELDGERDRIFDVFHANAFRLSRDAFGVKSYLPDIEGEQVRIGKGLVRLMYKHFRGEAIPVNEIRDFYEEMKKLYESKGFKTRLSPGKFIRSFKVDKLLFPDSLFTPEDLALFGAEPEGKKAEKRGKGWDVSFKEFLKREGALSWEAIKPKTKKELFALGIRGLSDVVPEAGFVLSLSMGGGIAIKETAGILRKRSELVKIGKRIREEGGELKDQEKQTISQRLQQIGLSKKRTQEYLKDGKRATRLAFYAHLGNTTVGKVLKEKSPSGLSGRARAAAVAVGGTTAGLAVLASESSRFMRIPVLTSVFRTAVARVALQYAGPRVADYLASHAGRFEEKQKKEWVGLAASASSALITASALYNSFRVTSGAGIAAISEVGEFVKEEFAPPETLQPLQPGVPTPESVPPTPEPVEVETPAPGTPTPEPIPTPESTLTPTPTVPGKEAPTPPAPDVEVTPPKILNVDGRGASDLYQDSEGVWRLNVDQDVVNPFTPEPNDPKVEVTLTETGELARAQLADGQTWYRDQNGQYVGVVNRNGEWFIDRGGEFEANPRPEEGDVLLAGKPEGLKVVLLEDQEGYKLVVQRIEFKDGSSITYNDDGTPKEAILPARTTLLFNPEAKGVMGIQFKLLQDHPEISPLETAKIATRLDSRGITADMLASVDLQAELAQVVEPLPPAEIVKEVKTAGGTWKLDEEGNVVEATLPDAKELFFEGKGVEEYQEAFAALREQGEPGGEDDLTPLQVGKLAQRAYEQEVDLNDPGALQDFINQDLPKITEVVETKIENLDRGQGFDTDGDGEEDTWWLKDPQTNKIEAGQLPDGRTLVLGEEGGPTGVVQKYIVDTNSNLAPPEVANIASNTVSEHDLKLPEKPEGEVNFDKMVGEGEKPAIIETMNRRIAQLSLQEFFEDEFRLDSNQALRAVRSVAFEPLVHEAVPNVAIGTEALDKLNARVSIPEKGVFFWKDAPWNDWLKEQGMLN